MLLKPRIIAELSNSPGEFDTAERRDQVEASLEAVGDAEGVQARMLDDVSNALPPSAAISRRRHPKVRKTRGMPAASRDLDHGR